MPAVYKSLVENQGLSQHTAWRVAFVVPGIVIVFVASCIIFLCPDSPTGKWSERLQAVEPSFREAEPQTTEGLDTEKADGNNGESPKTTSESDKEKPAGEKFGEYEAHVDKGEIVELPTLRQTLRLTLSPQVLVTGACYFCSFGTELAVNIILGDYYSTNFPWLSLQETGNWAAMFGLMNIWVRPAGGIVADAAFRYTGTLWSKKVLLHFYSVVLGVFLIAIGVTDPHRLHTLTLLIGIGLAFFVGYVSTLFYLDSTEVLTILLVAPMVSIMHLSHMCTQRQMALFLALPA